MERTMILWSSAFVAGATVFGLWYAVDSGAVSTQKFEEVAQMFSTEAQPVMVFLMPRPATLEATAAVIDEDDLVFEAPNAVAYRSSDGNDQRRILAMDRESASLAVNGAGWTEHPIEIVSVARRQRAGAKTGGGDPSDPANDDLSDLYAKPTLSRGEAIRVLRALNAQS